MDIKFEIEPIFKIEFFKIKCVNFKNKKYDIEKILKQYPEKRFNNFYSNRDKSNISWELQETFKDEFKLIKNVKKHLNLQIDCGIVDLFETLIHNKEINFKGRKRVMDICRDWNLLNSTNTLEEFFV